MKSKTLVAGILAGVLAILLAGFGGVSLAFADEEGAGAQVQTTSDEGISLQSDPTLQDIVDSTPDGGTIKLDKDWDLSNVLIVKKKLTLDLDGHKIYNTKDFWHAAKKDNGETAEDNAWSLIPVRGSGDLTITGSGSLVAKANDVYAVDVFDTTSKLTIESGDFVGNITAVYVSEGTLIINGGSFSIQQLNENNVQDAYGLTINAYDASYKSGIAKITITGGTFANFNPADNKAEQGSGVTSFVPEGYKAEALGDGSFKVVAASDPDDGDDNNPTNPDDNSDGKDDNKDDNSDKSDNKSDNKTDNAENKKGSLPATGDDLQLAIDFLLGSAAVAVLGFGVALSRK